MTASISLSPYFGKSSAAALKKVLPQSMRMIPSPGFKSVSNESLPALASVATDVVDERALELVP